jgi:hypothetical protein
MSIKAKPAPFPIVSRVSLCAAIAASVALGQSNLGSIQGAVVGSDGTPISIARVFAAVKARTPKAKVFPILMTQVAGAADISLGENEALHSKTPTNTFLINGLPAGTYVLCVETTIPGWLDPCHWSTDLPAITLTSGQKLTNHQVVMAKGAVVQIRVNDPSKLLTQKPGAIAHDVQVMAAASNNAYYHARIVSIDAGGRNHEVTLPFDAQHTLIVRSQQFTLTDAVGASVSASGEAQPFRITSGTSAPQYTFTVTSKAH